MKQKLPQSVYTQEFRAQAVKLVLDQGGRVSATAQQLQIPSSTLRDWVKAARVVKRASVGARQKTHMSEKMENIHLEQELARVKMERDFLKKCVAYFAKSPA